jgi:hypothetical protein
MIKGIVPRCLQLFGKWPILLRCVIAQPETEQMASIIWRVRETRPGMKYCHIIPEQHITRLQLH